MQLRAEWGALCQRAKLASRRSRREQTKITPQAGRQCIISRAGEAHDPDRARRRRDRAAGGAWCLRSSPSCFLLSGVPAARDKATITVPRKFHHGSHRPSRRRLHGLRRRVSRPSPSGEGSETPLARPSTRSERPPRPKLPWGIPAARWAAYWAALRCRSTAPKLLRPNASSLTPRSPRALRSTTDEGPPAPRIVRDRSFRRGSVLVTPGLAASSETITTSDEYV